MQSIGDERKRPEHAPADDFNQHHRAAQHNHSPRLSLVLFVTGAKEDVVVPRAKRGAFEITHFQLALLEIAVNNFDELFGRAVTRLLAAFRIDKVIPDVVLQYDGKKAVHRSPATGNPLQDVGAAVLFLKRPFDGFDLPLDTADPIKELLFFLHCMTHRTLQIPHRGI
jgi:hypothetical protein